jgi:hypothetical protein
MRIMMAAMGCVAAVLVLPMADVAQAQNAPQQARAQAGADLVVQPRRPRARVRIYRNDDDRGVYPSYNPGPDAVRECTATYVQEFRQSGTVIVPRMNCYWRRG